MRRMTLAAALAAAGMLALASVASADVGDIRELSLDQQLFGSASQVEVTGTIECQATIEYGLWVGVAQSDNPLSSPDDTFWEANEDDAEDAPEPIEGVGAFGPGFAPPNGISDDSPCSQAVQPWDVVVTQNRDSGDFVSTTNGPNMEVAVMAGTSAEDGDRAPGPFIGDMLGLDDEVTFERAR